MVGWCHSLQTIKKTFKIFVSRIHRHECVSQEQQASLNIFNLLTGHKCCNGGAGGGGDLGLVPNRLFAMVDIIKALGAKPFQTILAECPRPHNLLTTPMQGKLNFNHHRYITLCHLNLTLNCLCGRPCPSHSSYSGGTPPHCRIGGVDRRFPKSQSNPPAF